MGCHIIVLGIVEILSVKLNKESMLRESQQLQPPLWSPSLEYLTHTQTAGSCLMLCHDVKCLCKTATSGVRDRSLSAAQFVHADAWKIKGPSHKHTWLGTADRVGT